VQSYSFITVTYTSLLLGPSHSTKKILCQVPRVKPPFSIGIVTLEPSTTARRCECALSSILSCKYPLPFGIKSFRSADMSFFNPASFSFIMIPEVVCRVNITQIPESTLPLLLLTISFTFPVMSISSVLCLVSISILSMLYNSICLALFITTDYTDFHEKIIDDARYKMQAKPVSSILYPQESCVIS